MLNGTFDVDTSVPVFQCAVTDRKDVVDRDTKTDFVKNTV